VGWTAELRFSPDLLPLRRYGEFEDALNRVTADRLLALLITLAGDRLGSLIGRVQVMVRTCPPIRLRRALRCLGTLSRGHLLERTS
jgi:hypothetical protein